MRFSVAVFACSRSPNESLTLARAPPYSCDRVTMATVNTSNSVQIKLLKKTKFYDLEVHPICSPLVLPDEPNQKVLAIEIGENDVHSREIFTNFTKYYIKKKNGFRFTNRTYGYGT